MFGAKAIHNGGLIGPLAILVREPGQVRKEAAEAYDVCAGMWLVGLPPKFCVLFDILKSVFTPPTTCVINSSNAFVQAWYFWQVASLAG